MRCNYCGYDIPNGVMICPNCQREVQIVPDYNPLDHYLAENVKQYLNHENNEEVEEYNNYGSSRSQGRGTNADTGSQRRTAQRQATGRTSRTGQTSARGRSISQDEREVKKRRAAKKRKEQMRRKRRNRLILLFVVFVLLIMGASIGLYLNSYSGVVKRGYSALNQENYTKAEKLFKRAIRKSKSKPDAYNGLADMYILEGNMDAAEAVYTDAIDGQPENTKLYNACCEFYLDSDQPMKIPVLLEDLDDSLKEKLSKYVVNKPTFSLDSSETYDDVQQLTITTDQAEIYYTTDETDPTFSSTKYTGPIQIEEGTTTVQAFAANADGIPSETVTKTYEVQFPVEDAPAVSPSTGQYDSEQSIEINVPDGYTAYYTMDGTDPTTDSDVYEEPIDMPEGETLFKAILVNAKGRSSGITTRNYVRD